MRYVGGGIKNPELRLRFNIKYGEVPIVNKALAKKLGDIQKKKEWQEKEDKRIEKLLDQRSW